MALQVFEPGKGPLAVGTLEALLFFPRLSLLRDVLVTGGCFHRVPIVPRPPTLGLLAIGQVSNVQRRSSIKELEAAWPLSGRVSQDAWECGEEDEVRR